MVNVVVRDHVGRGMKFERCNVQITDSHFTNNNSTSLIMSDQSEFVFGNSHFLNNTNIYGVIRLNEKSKAHVTDSTFTGNQGRALMVTTQSKAITVECQFLYNAVKGKGAAVYVSDRSEYHDHRSLFVDNVAGEGGKIVNKKNFL